MNFEFFVMPENNIKDYVTHFRHEDKFMNISGFVTLNDNGCYNVVLSKKTSFNQFNLKEAIINALTSSK